MARRKRNPILPFLIGGVIGSATALVMAPASGRETRNYLNTGINRIMFKANEQKKVIVQDARQFAKDIVNKAEDIYGKSIKFAEGTYTASAESIDLEIQSIKKALDAAVIAYRDSKTVGRDGKIRESSEVIVNEMFTDFDDETLPKQEGMGRRIE